MIVHHDLPLTNNCHCFGSSFRTCGNSEAFGGSNCGGYNSNKGQVIGRHVGINSLDLKDDRKQEYL